MESNMISVKTSSQTWFRRQKRENCDNWELLTKWTIAIEYIQHTHIHLRKPTSVVSAHCTVKFLFKACWMVFIISWFKISCCPDGLLGGNFPLESLNLAANFVGSVKVVQPGADWGQILNYVYKKERWKGNAKLCWISLSCSASWRQEFSFWIIMLI